MESDFKHTQCRQVFWFGIYDFEALELVAHGGPSKS